MTTRPRRLVVLGGGRHQVGLVRRAQERDVDVVLVDYLPDAPARAWATTSLLVSTLDVDGVVRAARDHDVDGVVTTGTDLPVVTMAAVADDLGLPCWISPTGARAATVKSTMRVALDAVGVPMARQHVLGPGDESHDLAVDLPVVVKPADSQGQRGVTRVDDRTRLPTSIAHARDHSPTDVVVVEEFLVGPEVTLNAWVEGDHVVLLAINDRVTINPPPHVGIAYRHVHPTRHLHDGLLDRCVELLGRIADAYGMTSGPLYVQCILTGDGPVVVEAAARVGGGHEAALFPLVAGSGCEDRLIDLALTGRCAPWGHDMRTGPLVHASVTFVLGRAGTVAEARPIEHLEGTVESGWYVGPGDRLDELTTSLGRVGWFVTTAPSRAELDERAAHQYDHLHLVDGDGRSLVRRPEPELLLS